MRTSRHLWGSPLNDPKQWQGVEAANRSVMAATLLAAAVAQTAGVLVFELPSQPALVRGQLPALWPKLALDHFPATGGSHHFCASAATTCKCCLEQRHLRSELALSSCKPVQHALVC